VFEKLGRVWDLCCWGFGFPDDYPELNSALYRAVPFGQTRTLFRLVKREDQGDVITYEFKCSLDQVVGQLVFSQEKKFGYVCDATLALSFTDDPHPIAQAVAVCVKHEISGYFLPKVYLKQGVKIPLNRKDAERYAWELLWGGRLAEDVEKFLSDSEHWKSFD
jgi:hypothetical protein